MIKIFEEFNSKIEVGDFVYAKPECCGNFKVLKPGVRYKIYYIFNKYGTDFCILEEFRDQNLHINEFQLDCFIKETPEMKLKYNVNKFNI